MSQSVSSVPKPVRLPVALTQRKKAAVIVRLLLENDVVPDLKALSEAHQTALARDIATLRRVDRATLQAVTLEFLDELEGIALTFPDTIDSTLAALGDHLSDKAAELLRGEMGFGVAADPWARLAGLEPEKLLKILGSETPEIAAIMLSKLPVARAAELLGMLPGPDARRITFAVSRTSGIGPDTVQAIGHALMDALDAEPVSAFHDGPVARVGAILNNTSSATREDVLTGLDDVDRGFADEVRRAIFTFANIPARIAPRDVPKLLRELDDATLRIALTSALKNMPEAAEFILGNMSKRMAEQLREGIAESGSVSLADGEAAMARIVSAIRDMERGGDLNLLPLEEE